MLTSYPYRFKVHFSAIALRGFLLMACCYLLASTGFSQTAVDDPTFNAPTGPYGFPRAFALQSDGKLIVGGEFTYYAGAIRSKMARVNANGTLDNTFTTGSGFSISVGTAYVTAVIVQPDGKILAAGAFNAYNGTSAENIVRLNPNGTIDPTFVSPVSYFVTAMALQPDGKIVVGGGYPNTFTRLNNDGTTDNGFGGFSINNSGGISAIAIQPDGKILLGGGFSFGNGAGTNNNIARMNADGTQDMSFAASADHVNKILLRSDGKILLGTASRIFCVNPNGSAASGFTTVVSNGNIQGMVEQANGSIVLNGDFTTINSTSRKRIARVSAAGVLDPTYGTNGFDNMAYTSQQLPDGRIIFGGVFNVYASTSAQMIVCTNADGTINYATNSGVGIDNTIISSTVQPDGKIVVGGDFTTLNGVSLNRVARLMPNGWHDPTFVPGTGADNHVMATAIQSDGKILIAGDFTTYNGTARNRIARLSSTGALDATFSIGTGANSIINAMVVQPDGNILVGGSFSQFNGTTVGQMVRLTPTGAIDATFTTGLGTGFTGGTVNAILLQPDGKILVSGGFNYVNGIFRARIVRLNADGTVDASFVPPSGYANVSIDCMALQPDGKVVVGGHFNSLYNTLDQRLARLNTDGTADAAFTPNPAVYNYPYALAIQPDGKILVGSNGISRVNADGSLDTSFPYQLTYTSALGMRSLHMTPQGTTLTFGKFGLAQAFKSGTSRLKTAPAINATQTVASCGPFTWVNGVTYPISTTVPTMTYTTVNGIDSIVTLHLTILQPTTATVNVTACASYTWAQNGHTYTASGQYIDTIPNAAGCDSIVTLHLVIGQTSSTVNATACSSYLWAQNGHTYTASGQYIDTIANAAGCDSIVTLNLVILQPTSATINATACSSYLWAQNGQTYTTSGQYTDTIPNAAGCDSIVTLNLAILQPTSATINATACSSYTWVQNGQAYTISGQYIDTIANAAGCDSIVTLNLVILQPTSATMNETACTSYTWPQNGQTYTISGQYADTVPNAAGCDSIIALNLTITQPTVAIVNETVCSSYLWAQNGQTYTTSGQYADTIPNAAGCDSIITLNLTITQPTVATVNETACTSYTWPQNGQTYTISGQYADTIPNAAGCDSIVTLDLVIAPASTIQLQSFSLPSGDTTCDGAASIDLSGDGPFTVIVDNGTIVTTSGSTMLNSLCAGVHDLAVVGSCINDTTHFPLVIPMASNYVFNDPFLDSLALDSLGATVTNCAIFYNTIDSVAIYNMLTNGNVVTVVWNIIDANGPHYDTVSYELNNGSGTYLLQLDVFCPTKALGDYFTVTQAIYFGNGSATTASLAEWQLSDVHLYPNPTATDVTVEFSGPERQLVIYDAVGKRLSERTIHSGTSVTLEQLPAGMYLFELSSEAGVLLKRVEKQ